MPTSGSLGEKLASKGNPASILAYLAAGNLDLAVDAWVSQLDTLDAKKCVRACGHACVVCFNFC